MFGVFGVFRAEEALHGRAYPEPQNPRTPENSGCGALVLVTLDSCETAPQKIEWGHPRLRTWAVALGS